jgi:hypothetical protein
VAISKLDPSATKISRGPRCLVCVALASLPPTEAKALRGHLSNPAWRYTELSDALAADSDTPLDLKPFVLARHARGECAAGERLR